MTTKGYSLKKNKYNIKEQKGKLELPKVGVNMV